MRVYKLKIEDCYYKYIRSKGITNDNFRERVKYSIIKECNTEEEMKQLEDMCINYNNEYCLNMRLVNSIERVKVCSNCKRIPTGKRKKENYCCEKYTNKQRTYIDIRKVNNN